MDVKIVNGKVMLDLATGRTRWISKQQAIELYGLLSSVCARIIEERVAEKAGRECPGCEVWVPNYYKVCPNCGGEKEPK